MVYATRARPHPHMKRLVYGILEALPIQLGYGSEPHSIANHTRKSSESFKECTQRWRKLVARDHPPMLDKG